MMYKLAPSILSADFGNLAAELGIVEKAGAHYAHIDVMDGVFVPNITIGIPVIKSIRQHSSLIFDVHLMISSPEKYLGAFAECGADIINFHIEAAKNPHQLIAEIKRLGKKAAITLNPATPVEDAFKYADALDMVLIMSVEPGFGGQPFLYSALKKAEVLRGYLEKHSLKADIEMDGGIKLDNVRDVINAGANVVVAGSAIFGSNNKFEAVREFLSIENGCFCKRRD